MVLSVQSRLFHSVDEHIVSYMDLWQHLVKQLDSKGQIPADQRFLISLAATLQQRGLTTHMQNPQLIHAHLQTEAPRTLLFYHRVDRTASVTDIVALLSAIDVCQNVLGNLPVSIQWLIDSGNMPHPLDGLEILQPDGCLYYHAADTTLANDGTPILSLATKGHLRVELAVQVAHKAIDAIHAGIAPDALWRLLWALGTLKDAHEDILIEGFYDTLAPVQDTMMTQLHALPDTTAELTQRWVIQQPLMGLHGSQLHYAHLLLPTCTVKNIVSDTLATDTLLSGQASAQVDFYLLPDQDPQDIFDKLQRHLQQQGFSDVHAHTLSTTRPVSTSENDPFAQLAINSIEQAYAQKPLVLPATIGSYANLSAYMKAGTPTIFIASNEQNGNESIVSLASKIKQIALFIEWMAETHATRATE